MHAKGTSKDHKNLNIATHTKLKMKEPPKKTATGRLTKRICLLVIKIKKLIYIYIPLAKVISSVAYINDARIILAPKVSLESCGNCMTA